MKEKIKFKDMKLEGMYSSCSNAYMSGDVGDVSRRGNKGVCWWKREKEGKNNVVIISMKG